MKKYWVSKGYFGLYFAIIGFFVLTTIIEIHILKSLWEDRECRLTDFFELSLWLLGIVLIAGSLLFDFHGGKYAIDADGIRVHVGLKCYTHPWESLTHCGIVDVDVGGGTNTVDTYWIYFANRRLTVKERRVFLRKTRRDLVNIAFFQYEPEPFELALKYAPEHLRAQLEELPRPQKWKRSPLAVRKR